MHLDREKRKTEDKMNNLPYQKFVSNKSSTVPTEHADSPPMLTESASEGLVVDQALIDVHAASAHFFYVVVVPAGD
jgi:hypothetical protein